MKKSMGALLLAGAALLCGCQSRGSMESHYTEEAHTNETDSEEIYTEQSYSEETCTDESQAGVQTTEFTSEVAELTTPEQYAGMLSDIWREKWEKLPNREMSLPQANVFSGQISQDDYLTVIVYSSYAKNMAVAYRLSGGEVTELDDDIQAGFQLELLRDGNSIYLHTTTPFVGGAAGGVTEISDLYYSISEDKIQTDLNISRTEYGGESTSYVRYSGGDSYEQITAEEYIKLTENYAGFEELNMLRLDRDGNYINDSYILFEENPEQLKAAIAASLNTAEDIYGQEMSESGEVVKLLQGFGGFIHDYIDCKLISENTDENDMISVHTIISNGMYAGESYEQTFFRIESGEITTMPELENRLSMYVTESFRNSEQMTASLSCYAEQDGALYLAENAGSGGGLLGVDEVYLNVIEHPDESTLLLHMNAFGSKENWELDSDFSRDFTIALKRTEDGLRIDECGEFACGCLSWHDVISEI